MNLLTPQSRMTLNEVEVLHESTCPMVFHRVGDDDRAHCNRNSKPEDAEAYNRGAVDRNRGDIDRAIEKLQTTR